MSKVISVDQGGGKSSCNFRKECSPTLTCTHQGEPAIAYKSSGFVANMSPVMATQVLSECSGVLSVCHQGGVLRTRYKVLEGQFGATIRNNNNWWLEDAGTITTSNGDNLHSIVKVRTKGKQ